MKGRFAMKVFSLICIVFMLYGCTSTEDKPDQANSSPSSQLFSQTINKALSFSEPPFPRLGMWWPNPYEQPLDQIARYDWVILDNWSSQFLDPLRAINPKIRLLSSTNACELGFDPKNPENNHSIKEIPPEWFLTQVGSTLRLDINATQTNIPVEAVNIVSKTGEIVLFASGDTVLLEGESLLIKQVNSVTGMLTVERGYIRPASAHKKGTRIAAHISFWPNSWLLNVSTLSPLGTAEPAIGPEHWVDYHARKSSNLLADPRWDGLLVDRSDPDESWLIGNSSARSIDPDQSNRLLEDYQGFDEAWNAGLRSYLDQLRSTIGPRKIIFLNWGIPYFAVVNGNNFEGFPGDQDQRSWRSQIFGPAETGSYFEWMKLAQKPNLTMIETYEDNSSPKPNDTSGYSNRFGRPSYTPNFRKMRFGLASALLEDGYFSYEMNTAGHGSLGLFWFDEYDNAGAGRGYLGYPRGPAQKVLTELTGPNLLSTIEFDSGVLALPWSIWTDTGYSLSMDQTPGSGPLLGTSTRIDILQAAGSDFRASLTFSPIELTKKSDYTLSFFAKADKKRTLGVWAQENQDPWQSWLQFGSPTLSTEWQKFELTASALGTDSNARLTFGLGNTVGSVWLKDISLQKGNTDVWRRDFDHGIVLINATMEPARIELGGTFAKIDGTQDRSVNDGTRVREIVVPPRDGIILLRVPKD